jgi:hypothetical protein
MIGSLGAGRRRRCPPSAALGLVAAWSWRPASPQGYVALATSEWNRMRDRSSRGLGRLAAWIAGDEPKRYGLKMGDQRGTNPKLEAVCADRRPAPIHVCILVWPQRY